MRYDLLRAIRTLIRSPRFTFVAAGSIALGIAAASAIFSFVHSILLAPLPFPASDRLVSIQEFVKKNPVGGNPLRMADWLAAPSVVAVMGYYGENYTVRIGDLPERIPGLRTFGDFCGTLNVSPARGRGFTREEGQGRGGEVALITDASWKRRFAGDASVLGRKIDIDGHSYSIVGVLPPGAQLDDAEIITPEPSPHYGRRARFLGQIARLKPGAAIETARGEIATIASRLARQYPDTDGEMSVITVFLRDAIGQEARTPLIALLCGVGLLVIMAAVNVANLNLSRISARSRELAIRQAIGAGRVALIRLLFAEGVLIALAGGAIGLLLAGWAVDALVRFAPADLPRLGEVKLDGAVVTFAAFVTLGCALLCGLLPAWRQAGAATVDVLKEGGRGSRRSHQVQQVLVAAQIALSLILTIAGTLLFRSLWNVEHRPLGFTPDRLLSFRLSLPWQTNPERLVGVYDRVLDRLRALPSVEGAELTDRLPLNGDTQGGDVEIGGSHVDLADGSKIDLRAVSTGYHALMRVPLLAGRYLNPSDSAARRALINETAARRYFNGLNPLGRRIGLAHTDLFEIAGVVADLPDQVNAPAQSVPAIYVPFSRTFWPLAEFVVKTRSAPEAVASSVRREIATVDSTLAVEKAETIDDYLAERKHAPRLEAWLVGVFAAVAMLLACIGIFGLLAGMVVERRREIGIRLALGAGSGDVLSTVLAQGLTLTAIGIALGLTGAWLSTRIMQGLLFGVQPADIPAFVTGAAVLLLMVALACAIPALRATRVDPLEALRHD